MFSHQPTWDDCQQLLQVLFTTEEKERILLEAQKNVPGVNGAPTNLPNEINAGFLLNQPDWNYNMAQSKERLAVYRQAGVQEFWQIDYERQDFAVISFGKENRMSVSGGTFQDEIVSDYFPGLRVNLRGYTEFLERF